MRPTPPSDSDPFGTRPLHPEMPGGSPDGPDPAPGPDDETRAITSRDDDTRVLEPGDLPPGAPLPGRIGRYRILGKLGEGGMGVVYEAEQENPRRRVALKVVRGGRFVDDAMVKMFRREVETLGRLKHSGIGAIYESGHTEEGQHFFAMELVRGTTLDRYLDRRAGPLDAQEVRFRLHLFRKIADAVHYAHQRGVIHRDLKPSNIILGDAEGAVDSMSSVSGVVLPEIKVLDFGLARITETDMSAASMVTEVGQIKGTLPYMSPEQARGDGDAIDVRTDVYALGVILYRMLTGTHPYDVFRGSLVASIQTICEEAPRSLRQSWSGRGRIDADLETIVGTALEKEPGRRYASAAIFAEDVARYLSSQPITARPPSAMYQVRKFAARNRALVGGVAATFLVLVAGIVVSGSLGMRAERQRRVAEDEAARATATQEFLLEMITSADPFESKGPRVTLGEMLESAASRIGDEFEDRPAVQGGIRLAIARLYTMFVRHDDAILLLEPARDQLREAYPKGHRDLAECLSLLCESYAYQHRPEAIPMGEESVEMWREVSGPISFDLAVALHNLAFAYYRLGNPVAGDPMMAVSESLYVEALDIYEQVTGPENEDVSLCMTAMSWTLLGQDRFDEARALMERAFEMRRRILPPNHAHMSISHQEMAGMLAWTGGTPDSIRFHTERHVELAGEIYGPGSLEHLNAIRWAGEKYLDGLPAGRDSLRALELAEVGTGYRPTDTGLRDLLARALIRTGKADKWLERERARLERTASGGDAEDGARWVLLSTVLSLRAAHLQESSGNTAVARAAVREWVATARRLVERVPDDPGVLNEVAWELLTCDPEAPRAPEVAAVLAGRAVDLTDRSDPDILDTLALARFRMGRIDEAVALQREALALLPDDDTRREAFGETLARYEAGLRGGD